MTPTEAREFIAGTFGPARARTVITKLADQVEALTKERDFLSMANKDLSEAMNRYQQLQKERDELQKQVDDFCMTYRMKTDVENKKLTQERDALASAARLALDALEEATTYTSSPSWSPTMTDECKSASAALRQAGVQ